MIRHLTPMFAARNSSAPLWLAMVLACGLLLAPGAMAAGPDPKAWVTDVRLGQHRDHTRVVMRLDKAVGFELFTLADPYRIVIDFPQVGWRIDQTPLIGKS